MITYSAQRGVTTDTRALKSGQVFYALRGPNFDGNLYAKKALELGASIAVVDDPSVVQGDGFFLTDNVLSTLQEVAGGYRDRLKIPVIAICGSNGKTTTKELVHAVLSKKYRCFATKGNLNNHIGVPLSILSIQGQTEIAVLEIGANHLGETDLLCRIAKPTHGLITNNGMDHLEGFGSLEGVIKANGELFDYLRESGGVPFINTMESSIVHQAFGFTNAVTFPLPGNSYHCSLVNASGKLEILSESGKQFVVSMVGGYNFPNIAAALSIGKFFGVGEDEAIGAVASYTPGNNRSQLILRNGKTILLDAYNANPSSVEGAIRSFSEMDFVDKYLILGDMLELGTYSKNAHREILDLVANLGFKNATLIGKEFGAHSGDFPMFTFYPDKVSIPDTVMRQFPQGSAILIKGSRGIRMEELEKKIV